MQVAYRQTEPAEAAKAKPLIRRTNASSLSAQMCNALIRQAHKVLPNQYGAEPTLRFVAGRGWV